jgi:hypothetical protein
MGCGVRVRFNRRTLVWFPLATRALAMTRRGPLVFPHMLCTSHISGFGDTSRDSSSMGFSGEVAKVSKA